MFSHAVVPCCQNPVRISNRDQVCSRCVILGSENPWIGRPMMAMPDKRKRSRLAALCCLVFLAMGLYAQNEVLGEVEFDCATIVEKVSGVWIDGLYVGDVVEVR